MRQLDEELVSFSPEVRRRLEALRAEPKFGPHSYPPAGYTGPDTPEDLEPLVAIVNLAIEAVLSISGETIAASSVRPILHRAIEEGDLFATEDRERVWGYVLEIWYILDFHSPLFAELLSYRGVQLPDGYSEPLPPGWSSPGQPREID